MSNTIPVDIEFVLKNLNFEQEASKMKQGIRGVTSTVQKETDQITRLYKNMAAGLGTYLSARFLRDFVFEIANVRGEFQQLEVSLETILQSKSKADRLMGQVVQFAATTPFELADVAKGTKQLIAYGFAADDVIKNMKMLGDVAAGLSIPIGDLIYLYGTLNTQGRAYTRDILQFTSRGIPIVEALADQFGVAKDQIQGMVEAGEVGFKDVEKAFQSMTGEGGKFFGLIDNISQLIPVQIANLKDQITKTLNELGEENEGLISGSIEAATTLVKNYETVIDTLKVLVATYGAYKAATIAVAVAESLRTTGATTELIVQGTKLVRVTKTITAAQWLQVKSQAALNAVMSINPYVAAAVAITGLITVFAVYGRETKKVKDYIDELNKSVDQLGRQQQTDRLVEKYQELKDKAKLTKDEQAELNKTIRELGTIFPDAIRNTGKYGEALDLQTEKLIANNEALRENIRITTQENVDESQAKLNELIEKRDKLLREANSGKATEKRSIQVGIAATAEKEVVVNLSPDDVSKRRDEVNKLSGDIDLLVESINEGNQKLLSISAADAEKILAPYKKLFKQVGEYSKKQAAQVKEQLVKLLGEGLGVNANARIKDQIDALDKQLGLPTIKEQIEQTNTALNTAKAKLKELRNEGSQATAKQIEDQQKLVEDLTSKLELLTGVKQKDEKIKSIKEQLDDLYKRLETADNKDRDIIAGRIVELERELKLRKDIAETSVTAARNQEIKPKPITAEKIKGTITGPDGRPLFIGKDQVKVLTDVGLEFDKLDKRIIKIKDGSGKEQLEQMNEMVYAAQFLTDQLSEQLGLTEDQAELLKDGMQAMSGIANIASGNVIQGAAQLLSSALSMFVTAPEKLSEHYKALEAQVNKMLQSIEIAGKALNNINVNNLGSSLMQARRELADLANDAANLNDRLGSSSSQRRTSAVYYYSELITKAADLNSEIESLSNRLLAGNISDDQREAIEALLNSYNNLIDRIDAITRELTGTTVKELGESLAEVFLAGENAAEAWGEKVDDIIKHVITQQLSARLLNEPIKQAINQLVSDINDGEWTGDSRQGGQEINVGLTPEEAARFRESIQNIYDTAQPAFQEMIEALGEQGFNFGSDNSPAGLTGAIKGITEETAGLIAGQFTAMRIDLKSILSQMALGDDAMTQAILHLAKIEKNTSHNYRLETIENELVKMNKTLNDKL